MDYKFSIITVTYNCVSTIRHTIESVLSQKYDNYEYIVIDGQSTDGTKEIIEEYSDRIHLWKSESDNGIYNAMNKALNYATGDFVNFQGGDDYLVNEDVLCKVNEIMNRIEADIFVGFSWFGNRLISSCPDDIDELLYCIPNHQGTFMNLKMVRQYGGFDEKYRILADYELFIRMCIGGAHVQELQLDVANYGLGGISASEKILAEMLEIQMKYSLSLGKTYLVPLIIEKGKDAARHRLKRIILSDYNKGIADCLNSFFPNRSCCIWGDGKAGSEFGKIADIYGINIECKIDQNAHAKNFQSDGEGVCKKYSTDDKYPIIVITAFAREKQIEMRLKSNKMIKGRDYLLYSELINTLCNVLLKEINLQLFQY